MSPYEKGRFANVSYYYFDLFAMMSNGVTLYMVNPGLKRT